MRASKYYEFEFKPTEALEFYLREKSILNQISKYQKLFFIYDLNRKFILKELNAYFEKLAFLNEIELSDIEKMFNYLDYFPSQDEINEAKTDVLKCKIDDSNDI